MFAVSGLLIGANFVYIYVLSPRLRGCSIDAPEGCDTATKFSRVVLWISSVIYAIGFFSAFLLGPILMGLDS